MSADESVPPMVPAARIEFLPEDRRWIAQQIEEMLESGQLTLGRHGATLETQFAARCGTSHAVAVNSGTAALEIILRALDVAGRDVLVPANTFFATAAAVVHAGGRPVLMDTDLSTFGTDPEEILKRLTPNTAGAIVVHIGGLISPRMKEIQEVLAERNLWLVEDAAHAHGSSHGGTAAGAFGVAAAFSFYPTKVMTAGEGGMITTSDDRIAEEARIYRDQGKASFSQNAHTRMGYNWRMSEPHAVIALRHLQRLPEMIEKRQHIAALFDQGLASCSNLAPLSPPKAGFCNYYKYIATTREPLDRGPLKAQLREEYGVSLAGEVYEAPLQAQPIFEHLVGEPLPQSLEACSHHICLPLFPSMSDQEAQRVIDALQKTVG